MLTFGQVRSSISSPCVLNIHFTKMKIIPGPRKCANKRMNLNVSSHFYPPPLPHLVLFSCFVFIMTNAFICVSLNQNRKKSTNTNLACISWQALSTTIIPHPTTVAFAGSVATDDDDDVFWCLYSPSLPLPAKPYVLISTSKTTAASKMYIPMRSLSDGIYFHLLTLWINADCVS